jgi:oligoendopeptidase F
MTVTIPARDKINKKYTWNAESVFLSIKDWEDEAGKIITDIPSVRQFEERIKEGPALLLEAIQAVEGLNLRALRLLMYAGFSNAVDTTDQQAAGMRGRAGGVFGQVAGATAFLKPGLLAIGRSQLEEWMKQESGLALYRHSFDDLFRKQAHIRSGEVEELLGMLTDPFEGPVSTSNLLSNADFKFKPAVDSQGNKLEVTQGNYHTQLMVLPDRKARRTAWENYMDRYVEYKNTLAVNLTTSIKNNFFLMRTRKHDSTLAASLIDLNIPTEVFHNLINTFKKNLPVWHRYFELRRKVLGLKEIAYYDMWAPLTKKKVKVPYEKAVDLICEGLAPMGREYVETVRRGCLEERWVDVYPNQGKQNGAFSWGTHGTHPFIMMSYTDEMISLSTLAHELGHSMHSYLTWKHQPLAYADYSLFVAEVASNFHQALVRGHLLKTVPDRHFQIALLEEAMSNFFRYFFQMPILARFELETHQRVERGEALTADAMIDLMVDLFAEGFGPRFKMDRARVGMTWATFGHLFADYYVYSYATGISGAQALSARVLRGEKNVVQDYLDFLKAGASDYPLAVLKRAGVDLASPKPVEETFAVMEGYIGRLEGMLS